MCGRRGSPWQWLLLWLVVAAHQRRPDDFCAGLGAAYKGQPISTCPYKPSDPNGADWRRGWLSAATDTRLNVTPRDRDVVNPHGRIIAPARRTA